MAFPGPMALGRALVVAPSTEIPPRYRDAPRYVVDEELMPDASRLAELVDALHRHWARRRPFVVVLGIEQSVLKQQEMSELAPFELGAGFSFARERLHFLTWVNSWDLRTGDPVWWWSAKAVSRGAIDGGPADVILPDGRPAWIDGGPRGPLDSLDFPVVHGESVDLGSLATVPDDPGVGTGEPLAPDQRAAVLHGSGPARVIAPAGSGKTRTLVGRLRHLVEDRRVEPGLVCALAYNTRAAAEMRSRLGPNGAAIRTIHSLGWEIVRQARGDLRLIGERDQRRLLDRMVPVQRRPNVDAVGPYLEALSEVRIGLRAPIVVEASRDDVPGFADVFARYRRFLRDRQEADHDEQVYGAIEALLAHPPLRRAWQERCRHLLVDEFQDLTPGYLLLIRLVACPGLEVFGVGDDDQTIYGYAGADPGYLIDYDRLFPGADHHALQVNYRCPPEVVTAAANLLAHNHRRVDKEIHPGRETGEGGLDVLTVPGPEMARALVEAVKGLVAGQADPAEIAVLCRVNSALLPVHVALADADIPFTSPIDGAILDRTVLSAALAWLRLALDPDRMARGDLMQAVRRPSRGITRLMGELVRRSGAISLDQLVDLGRTLDGSRRDRWEWFCDDILTLSAAAHGTTTAGLIEALRTEIGLDRAAAALDAGRTRADRAAQSDDVVALERAAVLHPDPATFEGWLRRRLQSPDADGVVLSTVHRVKGLEWPHVLVFGADRGLMPHELSDDPEEERRVFHVAITRASNRTMVFADRDRPSPYLEEMKGKSVSQTEAPPAERQADGIVVAAGDEVTLHGGFRGVVVRIDERGASVELTPGPGRVDVAWGDRITTRERAGILASETTTAGSPDEGLLGRLREWRLATARERGVPAYVIFHDSTLEELATRRPSDETELIRIPGVGPAKLDAFGEEVLEILSETATGNRRASQARG